MEFQCFCSSYCKTLPEKVHTIMLTKTYLLVQISKSNVILYSHIAADKIDLQSHRSYDIPTNIDFPLHYPLLKVLDLAPYIA